jgi:hypothetical protein
LERALLVLETVASPEAEAILRNVAKLPDNYLTARATSALNRIAHRKDNQQVPVPMVSQSRQP